jgi:hypothetical protein
VPQLVDSAKGPRRGEQYLIEFLKSLGLYRLFDTEKIITSPRRAGCIISKIVARAISLACAILFTNALSPVTHRLIKIVHFSLFQSICAFGEIAP